jgi:hypothetical protein
MYAPQSKSLERKPNKHRSPKRAREMSAGSVSHPSQALDRAQSQLFFNWIAQKFNPGTGMFNAYLGDNLFGLGTFCRLFAYIGLNPSTGEPLDDALKTKMNLLEPEGVQTVGEYVAHKLSEPVGGNPPLLELPQSHPQYRAHSSFTYDMVVHVLHASHNLVNEALQDLYNNVYKRESQPQQQQVQPVPFLSWGPERSRFI